MSNPWMLYTASPTTFLIILWTVLPHPGQPMWSFFYDQSVSPLRHAQNWTLVQEVKTALHGSTYLSPCWIGPSLPKLMSSRKCPPQPPQPSFSTSHDERTRTWNGEEWLSHGTDWQEAEAFLQKQAVWMATQCVEIECELWRCRRREFFFTLIELPGICGTLFQTTLTFLLLVPAT